MRFRNLSVPLLGAIVAAVAACASTGAPNARTTESSPDRITAAEIQAVGSAQSAYDLVRQLRPRWLQNTSCTTSMGGGVLRQAQIAVYLDGNRLGGIDALRTLSASGVKSMQYLDAVRAATVLREADAVAAAIVINTN